MVEQQWVTDISSEEFFYFVGIVSDESEETLENISQMHPFWISHNN